MKLFVIFSIFAMLPASSSAPTSDDIHDLLRGHKEKLLKNYSEDYVNQIWREALIQHGRTIRLVMKCFGLPYQATTKSFLLHNTVIRVPFCSARMRWSIRSAH
ncbi:unnamed protein product [Caenorhabditis angaria]|uniref:Uncharacterized protein n=1 Tax=Caenorhabditis angaria TaxID=860376 RepID=A0A9P1IF42_9PELO|nr:unnamed protein product [Caenorhabditis angaria]